MVIVMKIMITGKGIDLGDSLREFTEKETANLVDKYIGDELDSSIIISKDNRLFSVEICLRLHHGFMMKANGLSDDPYRAVSTALEKLEERIKKHKNRIKDKHRRTQWADNSIHATKYIVERKHSSENAEEEHLTIAEQESEILSLSVSEAVMKLDLADVPVVMFKNADSGHINVVYKRPDGHTGWIDYKE